MNNVKQLTEYLAQYCADWRSGKVFYNAEVCQKKSDLSNLVNETNTVAEDIEFILDWKDEFIQYFAILGTKTLVTYDTGYFDESGMISKWEKIAKSSGYNLKTI